MATTVAFPPKVSARSLYPVQSPINSQVFSPKSDDDVIITTSIETKDAGYASKYIKYHVLLRCPITKRSWTVTTRYSAVLAFREALNILFVNYMQTKPVIKDNLVRELLLQLAWLLDAKFPPKRFDSEANWVTAERAAAFRTFFCRLIDSKLHLVDPAATSVDATWMKFVKLVQTFLQVPTNMLNVEYEKVNAVVRCPDCNDCSICLAPFSEDDLSVPGVVVKTQCGHVFHQGCLAQWMGLHASCPICRHDVDSMVGFGNFSKASGCGREEFPKKTFLPFLPFDNHSNHNVDEGSMIAHQIQVEAILTTDKRTNEVYHTYRISLICPVFHRWWVIRARYSKIRRFYDELMSLRDWLTIEKNEYAELLNQMIELSHFPSRRIFNGSQKVLDERSAGFRIFFYNLLQTNLHLQSPNQSNPRVRQLVHLIQTFLCLPQDEILAPEFVPEVPSAPAISDIAMGVPLTEAPDMNQLYNNNCTVCLAAFTPNEFHNAGSVVKTSCEHLFHAECIDHWIEIGKTTCPICRKAIDHITALYNA
ncbi:hypothetical protein THRCLA_05799 [Thraustotheca clavata]|uniref:RING-type domain-containing protein n=1 Tax=Thraustotheca clavata TaxID=74557 RepID=A0A1V9ZST3_9STRA|nr:hypothetical protein THRCLA_05799 [Thraustotheca clavata]